MYFDKFKEKNAYIHWLFFIRNKSVQGNPYRKHRFSRNFGIITDFPENSTKSPLFQKVAKKKVQKLFFSRKKKVGREKKSALNYNIGLIPQH